MYQQCADSFYPLFVSFLLEMNEFKVISLLIFLYNVGQLPLGKQALRCLGEQLQEMLCSNQKYTPTCKAPFQPPSLPVNQFQT